METHGDSETDDEDTGSLGRVIDGVTVVSVRQQRSKASAQSERLRSTRDLVRGFWRRYGALNHIDSDDIGRTLGVISIRALGVRSSYKGRTVDASAMRGDEGRGQLRKASGSR